MSNRIAQFQRKERNTKRRALGKPPRDGTLSGWPSGFHPKKKRKRGSK